MSYLDPETGSSNFFKDFAKKLCVKEGDVTSVIKIFDQISPGYHSHMSPVNIPLLEKLVALLSQQVELDQNMTKSCSILDACCGSGLVGQCLRKAGFTGNLEGFDGAQGMLNEAAKLEIYDKLYAELLTPDGNTALPKENYDVVIAGYSFFLNSLGAEHIPILFNHLKVGGFLVFNLQQNTVDVPLYIREYFDNINQMLSKVLENKLCQRVAVQNFDGFSQSLKYFSSNVPNQVLHDELHCYKKLDNEAHIIDN